MARIIRPDSPARARSALVAALSTALADLDGERDPADVRDRLAYAGLVLRELERSTERTAEAWENRGYWLKADQFRRDWKWAAESAAAILGPLLEEDLSAAQAAALALLARLSEASDAPAPKGPAKAWAGAFERVKNDPRPLHGR
jgi:hypothetical protein